jgi:hypothetical protein
MKLGAYMPSVPELSRAIVTGLVTALVLTLIAKHLHDRRT